MYVQRQDIGDWKDVLEAVLPTRKTVGRKPKPGKGGGGGRDEGAQEKAKEGAQEECVDQGAQGEAVDERVQEESVDQGARGCEKRAIEEAQEDADGAIEEAQEDADEGD